MKELYMLAGFAIGIAGGMIAGTLLYKHCGDTRSMIDEAEKCIAKEVDKVSKKMKGSKKDG